jgi:hypothetical protein
MTVPPRRDGGPNKLRSLASEQKEKPMPMKSLYIAAAQRLGGKRPSAVRAAAGAAAAGTATGVVVYRLLRHEKDDD